MGRYWRCPNCLKWLNPWWRCCPKCGNNLEFNTHVSKEYHDKRKKKLEKNLEKFLNE